MYTLFYCSHFSGYGIGALTPNIVLLFVFAVELYLYSSCTDFSFLSVFFKAVKLSRKASSSTSAEGKCN